MTQANVHIRKLSDSDLAVGWAGQHTLTIDRSERSGGAGRGFSGGELVRLTVGACYAIALSREAAQRGMALSSVDIDVQAEWAGSPERVQQITCALTVAAPADEAAIRDLIRHVDQTAEVVASLRTGFAVTLVDVRVEATSDRQGTAVRAVPEAHALLEMVENDIAGATCAVLTPAINARLRELERGQILEVRVADPGARDDIAAWCRLAGHELLAVVDDTPAYTRYFLGKGGITHGIATD